jgi:hypothetical protein
LDEQITAVEWLKRAAIRFGLPRMGEIIEGTLHDVLPLPLNDPRYRENALVPDGPPLEVSFSEADPGSLRFDFEPCVLETSPKGRLEKASNAALQWVKAWFDPAVVRDYEQALKALQEHPLKRKRIYGAFLGAVFDKRGPVEAKIYCELSSQIPKIFPPRIVAAGTIALSGVRGLTPHFVSLACCRQGCIPRLYFLCREELPFVELGKVLAPVGLDDHLPQVIFLSMIITGNRVAFPASSVVLSFRERADEIDCKVEILVRGLHYCRETIEGNLRSILSERPETRIAVSEWARSLGETEPFFGGLNSVGFRVSKTKPVQLGLYMSPTV